MKIDWENLTQQAINVLPKSYSPYSKFPVGAAAICDDGRIITGVNVENASYGLALCAECSLVSELFRTGGGQLVAFACVDGQGNPLMPCGRCRQLLYEHSAEGMLLQTVSGIKTINEVLPDAFGPKDLHRNEL
jgi:cytidine deaminase